MAKNDDWGKDAKVISTSGDWGKDAKEVKKDEPGWFMPGSKSDALVRGFSQAATFGFGDEIQSYLRAIGDDGSGKSYLDRAKALRDEERNANATAARDQTGAYIGGNIIAALPQAANVASLARAGGAIAGSQAAGAAARAAGAGGTYGAMHGAGQAQELKDVPKEAAKGAAISGAINAAIPAGGAMLRSLGGAKVPVDAAKAMVDKTGITPALAGAGLNLVASDTQSTDPASWIAEKAIQAGKGAAAGWALGKAPQVLGQVGKQAARGAGTAWGEDAAYIAASTQPFSSLVDYLKQAQGATNPEVEQAAQMIQDASGDGSDPQKVRKAAMAASATPEGRAVGNSTSPIRDQN